MRMSGHLRVSGVGGGIALGNIDVVDDKTGLENNHVDGVVD